MIILVTGIMRTGTSLTARQLNRMGVPMGTHMRFPLPQENGQEDYEDIEFTEMMLERIRGNDDSHRDDFLHRIWLYEQQRLGPTGWPFLMGMKSPFALPYVEDIREAVEAEIKVVLCTRNITETYVSLGKQSLNPELIAVQDKLRQSLDTVKHDLAIDISEHWNSPDEVKTKLDALIRN